MCEFLSFLATEKGVYFGDFYSHSGIETAYKLKPSEYCECEWLDDSLDSLYIRGSKELSSFIRAMAMADWKSRSKFLGDYKKGAFAEGWFKSGKFHREGGPAYVSYCENGRVYLEEYYKGGKFHREGGPAHICHYDNGKIKEEEYYKDGKLHREGGPAIIYYRYDNGESEAEMYYQSGRRVEKR